ncbi:uncharacterized protein A4U43_C05F14880, partial [Asparagus officinalis]
MLRATGTSPVATSKENLAHVAVLSIDKKPPIVGLATKLGLDKSFAQAEWPKRRKKVAARGSRMELFYPECEAAESAPEPTVIAPR